MQSPYNSKSMIIGIETSCDETASGIVDEEGRLLSNVVASQAELHASFGGIVPEVASRRHIYDIAPVVRRSLDQAGADWDDIDAIAVTHGPGLAGSLMVGVNYAKGLAASTGKPLIGANHLVGHIMAAFIRLPNESGETRGSDTHQPLHPELDMAEGDRIMCLIVSGGHTELVLCIGDRGGELSFELIGETRDDAAGEAFDKAARAIGLSYPGGPAIQQAAATADEADIDPLPRAWLGGSLEFSFSGLKTAVINRARERGLYPPSTTGIVRDGRQVASIARAFQDSVVDVLVDKTVRAAQRHACQSIAVVGGVAANSALRGAMIVASPVPVAIPPISLCTDNGAMIARAGLETFKRGQASDFDLDVIPSLRIA